MFFILSKILFFFILPVTWVAVLLIWAKLTKKPRLKKRLFIVAIIVSIVFSNPFLYRSAVMSLQMPRVDLPDGKVYEAGILLGGLAGYDKYNKGYFGENADRFIQTANLYHRGIIKKIIISGGNGSLYLYALPEAIYLREQFLENGVADSAIIMETKSRNTYENALFSKEISDSMHLQQPFVLITSAFHMRRAMSSFNKAGLKCIPFPCDFKELPQKFTVQDTIIPDLGLLYKWSITFKELIGLAVYRATGKAS
jgi:uncharacterized SAM-binding protein YcdF (DUF218 family)